MRVRFLTDWCGYARDVVYDIENDTLLRKLFRLKIAIPIAKSIDAPVADKMVTGAPIKK